MMRPFNVDEEGMDNQDDNRGELVGDNRGEDEADERK
jgi:hypothetical protein